MWLHIQNNDPKHINKVKEVWEEVSPGQNIYAISRPSTKKLVDNTVFINNVESFSVLLASRDDWDGVIFNPLDPSLWKWLKYIPYPIPVVWYRWGYEAYSSNPTLRKNLYMPKTKSLIQSRLKSFLKDHYHSITYQLTHPQRYLKRVDICVAPEEQEFKLYKDVGLLKNNTIWQLANIGYLEEIDNWEFVTNLGEDIKIGNSAEPSNNHIEAFELVSQLNLMNRKVIVPLSYGNKNYKNKVIEAGYRLLGDHFHPLIDFMPLSQYNELMNQCGYTIMNHLRQQAGGNVIADLLRGSRVFMNNTTFYQWLVSNGLSAELIEDIDVRTFFTKKEKNRILEDHSIFFRLFNRNKVIEYTVALQKECKRIKNERKSIKIGN